MYNQGLVPWSSGGVVTFVSNYTGNGNEACGFTGEVTVKLPPLAPGEVKMLRTATLKMPAQTGVAGLALFFDATCKTFSKPLVGLIPVKVMAEPTLLASPSLFNLPVLPSKKTSGEPNDPVLPAPGSTVTWRGALVNTGGAKIPKGVEVGVWLGSEPSFVDYKGVPCQPPAGPPNATFTLKQGIGFGKSAPFEVAGVPAGTVPAGKASVLWGALFLIDPDCKVFSNATGFLPFNEAGYILPSAPLPSLTPYVKALRPAKPAPGGTMTVTLGVRNDGAADGKVGAVAAWSDGLLQSGTPCAWKNATVLTPAFDVTVPPGKEATVSFELPAAAAPAGAWRKMAVVVDANCTNAQVGPPYGPLVQTATEYYATKGP